MSSRYPWPGPGPPVAGIVEFVSAWHGIAADSMKRSPLGWRLKHIFSKPILVCTDYSGCDSPRESFRVCCPALSGALGQDLPMPFFLRSCVGGQSQQYILKRQSLAFTDGVQCLFTNILDRVHPNGRVIIEQLAPSKIPQSRTP